MKSAKKKTDAKLVSKAIKGDKESLSILCEQKAHSILYACKCLTGNIHEAEDLSQNVVVRICEGLGSLKNSTSFDAWLYSVIRNEFLLLVRNNGLYKEYPMEGTLEQAFDYKRENLPDLYLEDNEKRRLLQELLDDLPTDHRYCLVMFYFEDMTYKEIAEVMKMSEGNVKVILHRSKIRMRNLLEKKPEGKEYISSFAVIASPAVLGAYMKQEAAALSIEALMPSLTSAIGQMPAQVGAATLLSTKVTAAIGIATAAALAVGVGISVNQEMEAPPAIISSSQTASVSVMEQENIVIEEDISVGTLEDMIGAENADLLRQFSITPPSNSEWQQFIQATGLVVLQENEHEGTFYLLYALEKQDKRLMVIVKQTGQEEIQGLVYNFDTIEKAIPTYYEVIQSYEAW